MPGQNSHPLIEFDPNVQVHGDQTRVLLERLPGPVHVGQDVALIETDAGLHGEGRIARIDVTRRLVYITVNWDTLSYEDPGAETPSGSNLQIQIESESDAASTPSRVDAWTVWSREAPHFGGWGAPSTHMPAGYLSPVGLFPYAAASRTSRPAVRVA